jgi:hypothetical protein
MLQIEKTRINQDTVIMLMSIVVLMIGVATIVLSTLNGSSFLAIFGLALAFWAAILLYVTPSKHVPLTLFNASAEAAVFNIERLILELNLSEKGVYLPPKNLKNIDSSLVFIPKTIKTPLPTPEETNEKLLTNEKTGAFVTRARQHLLQLQRPHQHPRLHLLPLFHPTQLQRKRLQFRNSPQRSQFWV